jgi:iron complex outermembrane receptor protein
MNRLLISASSAAILATMGATGAMAASSDATNVEAVVVTGTRTTGLKAVDSPAPIQVLDAGSLNRVGQPDLVQSLAQNVPSFTAQAFGGDAANLTLSARLRGLSPNHALVLMDGKRRHGTSNLAVLGGPYQGGASADLNFIPVAAIDHVEVLTDGAAAQYGTDAIAGVINIILKKKASGGSITVSGGAYNDEGGDTADVSANIGFAPLGEKSYLNLTAESRFHGHSLRGNVDPRVYNHDGLVNVGPGGTYSNATKFGGYPYNNRIQGDALYHVNVLAIEAGYEFSEAANLYANFTYGHKNGQSFENYRTPDKAPNIWPNGYNPKEELMEDDYAFTVGLKGVIAGWNYDLSNTYGKDDGSFYTEGSANNALAASAGLKQTMFYDGAYVAGQNTTDLDLSRDFAVGMATPLTVAVGIEQRHDTYEIKAGEPNSYLGSGAASFPGFMPVNAGNFSRDNTGLYADLAVSPVTQWKVDAAVRWEHFSDFGDTTVGKLTSRYDFTPAFAIRGTASTGFRAPTLAEEYYANVNVGPSSAFGQLGPNSPAAKALGISGLKPEKSTNFSGGVVLHPTSKITATVDAYYIKIKDRIVGSGNVYGYKQNVLVSAAVQQALVNFAGAATVAGDKDTGINIFANGIDTSTKGVEFVVTDSETYGDYGKVDYSVSGTWNETKVDNVKPSPAAIGQALYDKSAISALETQSPQWRVNFGALWTYGKFTVNLRESFYGESSSLDQDDDGVWWKTTIKPSFLTDIEASYAITSSLRATVGGNNVFDKYPDKVNPGLTQNFRSYNDNGAVQKYPGFSPYGINGGYYYAKVTYTF